MKKKFLVILLLLVISLYPSQFMSIAQTDEPKPSAPIFKGIAPNGINADNIFAENTTIEISYEVDRFDTAGIILLGNGSGLSLDPASARNFTLDFSSGPTSFYVIELNVTEYTYFLAYSWFTNISNRTVEEFDQIDNAPGHQLWVEDDNRYPTFVDVEQATAQDETLPRRENEEFYVAEGSNVTIIYETTDPDNSTAITLSFANSTKGLYNESLSVRVLMTQITFSVSGISRFEYNYTITQRIVYFSAFTDFGWERFVEDTPFSHTLTNGFSMETVFTEKLDEYTDIDTIVFNVTSINGTDNDEYSFRYRYFENSTSDDPVVDWIETSLTNIVVNKDLVNETIDGTNFTQTVTTYNSILNLNFNVSNLVEIQVFVEYFGSRFNESTPYSIIIQDSKPSLKLLTVNETISRFSEGFINWEYSTLRGSISEATINSNTTDLSQSILNFDNFTISFTNLDGDTIEGDHLITITVTNSFEIVNITDPDQSRYIVEVTNEITAIYRIDVTGPSVSLNALGTPDSNGRITVNFNFEDLGINPTGILIAKLDWGDGVTIDVTSLNSASRIYRKSGTYSITLTVLDNAGNTNSTTIDLIEVTVPTTLTSINRQSPVSTMSIILGFIFLGLLSYSLKRRRS